mgnify:CR=1 FL=1
MVTKSETRPDRDHGKINRTHLKNTSVTKIAKIILIEARRENLVGLGCREINEE